ncbi:hypothetical protein [Nocardioides sp. MH1]|uniref:hypothetical protein n=1 Tax=Nocardioides sp. MH1 TaxID=3242490 RepID=UPI003520A4B7
MDEVDDPLAVVAAVGDAFAALDDALEEIAVPRLRAIARLRAEGWTYERLAQVSGLSKGRIAQLAREAARRGL